MKSFPRASRGGGLNIVYQSSFHPCIIITTAFIPRLYSLNRQNGLHFYIKPVFNLANLNWTVWRAILRFWIECQTNFSSAELGSDSSKCYTSFLQWLIDEMQASARNSLCKLYIHTRTHSHTRHVQLQLRTNHRQSKQVPWLCRLTYVKSIEDQVSNRLSSNLGRKPRQWTSRLCDALPYLVVFVYWVPQITLTLP